MFGLAYLLAFALYLLISIGVVRWAIRYARDNGRSAKRWGWGAAFVMYSLVFWDWLPTVATHQYYCAKDSGFWVYKTVDQWKAENPGVMEGLVATRGEPSRYKQFDDGHGKTDTYFLNERFNWVVTQQDMLGLFPVIRTEREVKDIKKNEVLARYIDFASGNSVKNTVGPPGPLKFWLSNQHCRGGEGKAISSAKFFKQFKGAEK